MNNLSIALKICDFKFDHEFLTNLLGIVPTDIHKEGFEYEYGSPLNKIIKKYESNYWEYRIHVKRNSVWIKTIIDKFVEEVIFNKIKAFESIKNLSYVELYIGVYFDTSSGLDSFHFDHQLIKLFSELNIEIDIDQYIVNLTEPDTP